MPAPQGVDDREQQLEALRELRATLDVEKPGPAWGTLQRLLVKSGVDPSTAVQIVVGRDLERLDALLDGLARGEDPVDLPTEVIPEEDDSPPIPEETLREAMKAYRRRHKLMKLDHESKLGRNPLTTGKAASFESIIPPHQFPENVWRELATRGELEATGQGFYKLPVKRPEF